MKNNDSEKNQYILSSLANALDVIDALSTRESMSLAEISEATGINKTSCFRILYTLMAKGYVDKKNDTNYRLSLLFLRYGSHIAGNMDIVSICKPYMKELRDYFNEVVHLVILDSKGQGVFIHKEYSNKLLQMQSRIGYSLDAPYLATGKMILSTYSDEEIREIAKGYDFKALTSSSITSTEMLLERIETIRKDGFATDDEESETGLCCLAGPIYDANHKCIASISLSTNPAYMKAHKDEIIEKVLETCRKCSDIAGLIQ